MQFPCSFRDYCLNILDWDVGRMNRRVGDRGEFSLLVVSKVDKQSAKHRIT